MTPEQRKRVFAAKDKIQTEMQAMMDSLEKEHGSSVVLFAHHLAGLRRTLEIARLNQVPIAQSLTFLHMQIEALFESIADGLDVKFEKIHEVGKGIFEVIGMQQADLNEALNGIPKGESNATNTAKDS